MVDGEAPEETASDPLAEALRCADEAGNGWPSQLDRRFFAWYWPLMSGEG
jgi:hypothetical protein